LDIGDHPAILIGIAAQAAGPFARGRYRKIRLAEERLRRMAKKEVTPVEKKSPAQEEKARALEAARLQIEKQFGKGSLMKLGESSVRADVDVIPSGSILLDAALGVGGYPRGRVVEIYGPEASGKTTLALHAIAESQKKGGIAAFVDAEHALDPVYARNLGVNVDELWVSQPDTGEQALEIVESLVRSGAMDIIVVDSVAALTPRAEIEGEMGDSHMGLQARLMSQALRKLTATISKTRTCLIFINQIRMKIGVMFGNPETTTGGFALKFYSSLRLEVRKVESIARGNEEVVGNKVRVKVVKNKVAPPFRKAEMDIMFGKGISAVGSLLEAALQCNLVEKAGSWYSYGKERIGQGVENARLFLESNPAVYAELEKKVRETLFATSGSAAPAPSPAAEPAPAAAPSPASGLAQKARAAAAAASEDDGGDADPGKEAF
jgi:recombination protein RecA